MLLNSHAFLRLQSGYGERSEEARETAHSREWREWAQ